MRHLPPSLVHRLSLRRPSAPPTKLHLPIPTFDRTNPASPSPSDTASTPVASPDFKTPSRRLFFSALGLPISTQAAVRIRVRPDSDGLISAVIHPAATRSPILCPVAAIHPQPFRSSQAASKPQSLEIKLVQADPSISAISVRTTVLIVIGLVADANVSYRADLCVAHIGLYPKRTPEYEKESVARCIPKICSDMGMITENQTMVRSLDLQAFIIRARVLKLYREALRTARRSPTDARDELRRTMRQEMEENRHCNDKQKIRFLISEGLRRLKDLDEMLDMQGL